MDAMNYGGISLEAYGNRGDGFNDALGSDVAELNKAIEATDQRGGAVDGSTTASGAPLKVESLEKTLKVVTFTQKHIVLWKKTPVLPAYNTVEEYNKLISYGSDEGGFTDEGELPLQDDATYVRDSELVKYLGNTRIVTHPMTLVNTAHGAVIQREIQNGTNWILQKVNKGLIDADSKIVPQQFNGLFAQMRADYASEIAFLDSENVIDMRGYSLTEKYLEQGSNSIIENYGFATDIFWAPKAGSDFARSFYPRQRVSTPVSGNNAVGSQITKFVSQAGEIDLNPDVFMKIRAHKTSSSLATSSKAPAAPVADGTTPVAAVAATVANNKFASGDAGTYMWAVSALNKDGESAITILSTTPASIVANGAAALKFTAGSGTYSATGFRIYRADKGASYTSGVTKFYPLFDVSASELSNGYNGGSAGVVYDLNRWLPNTTKAVMMQRDLEFFSFKQLAPLMKMDLALLSPAYRFMVLLYGTPLVYAPRKGVFFINVGSLADSTTNALIA